MKTRKTVVAAPGKLILLGEYAVLEGAPALVAAVNRQARVSISPGKNDCYSVSAPTLDILPQRFELLTGGKLAFPDTDEYTRQQLSFFSAALETALQESGLNLPPVDITLNTNDFYLDGSRDKLGFGSSAALSAALLYGFHQQANVAVTDRYALFQQAGRAHYRAQGKMGSGIDIAASVFGGVLKYEITPGDPQNALIEPLEMPSTLLMLVVWAGQPASTRKLVARVKAFGDSNPQKYTRLIDEMRELSFGGIHAAVNGEHEAFLECVNRYFEILSRLGKASKAGIITPAHTAISRICQRHGATYKSSGAGGGDIGVAFATSAAVLEAVGGALLSKGFHPLDVAIAHRGVHLTNKHQN